MKEQNDTIDTLNPSPTSLFLPLCRPGGASEARFLGLHGGWMKADRCSASDGFGSSRA